MNDLQTFGIPGHVTIAEGTNGLPKVLIETSGSSAEIYLHGAHVTHFQITGEAPLIFLSEASEFHPEKAIRGGIPMIFPWFGPREGFPAHGFARTAAWNLTETSVLADGSVRLSFHLPNIDGYGIKYGVTVGRSLSLEWIVTNTSDQQRTFETCLHTYFQISNIHDISITGLQDAAYHDKVAGTDSLETTAALRFESEVDRVYSDTTSTVEIHDPGFKRTIRVEKSGSNSTVVWNPWIEKSKRMADFGDDEYLQMVCVESGNVAANHITLPPGGRTAMTVEVSSEKLA